MRVRRVESGVGFNVWTVQGTWFWLLVYPDRHGGAIGAAATEVEAVREACAAIDLLSELGCDCGLSPCLSSSANPCASAFQPRNDVTLIRAFPHSREPSEFGVRFKVDGASAVIGREHPGRKRGSNLQKLRKRYNNVWHSSLASYAARVAAA